MVFKLISIATLVAFYGCYFIKMLRQKKARNTDRPDWKGQSRFCEIRGSYNEDCCCSRFRGGTC